MNFVSEQMEKIQRIGLEKNKVREGKILFYRRTTAGHIKEFF